ncbi:2-hydroxyacid dehydrogenase [Nocardioides hwasunensis]|uniref:2-hydroxyacid dehydrogenase n=1 Tax=Nocardioides hwasunensis TaxID=397258 RepID=A0ABR8MNH6_9ACTN|nr:2-hydroxyacid dehydrogenase [Nocardioides hwasunensis]MBD3916846.1 2-hydroxyacid dehydrogenase [Nocardioides hwasunensis]
MKAVLATRTLADAVGPVDGVDIEVWNGEGPAPEGEVDLWVPHYATRADVLDRAHQLQGLQVVQLQSAGYDGVLDRLPAGVTLCNASGVHDDATAEHAVGLVLASLRGIPEAVRSHGHWESDKMRRSLADSRVLVLGYGSIGRALAERLIPMKAVVTAVASRERDDDLVGRVRAIDDLRSLLPDQDVLVALVPLNDTTRGLLDDETLGLLPDGALVVNVARGRVVDTDAVIRQAGRLRFALDVTDPEPLPEGHPLWDAPGVLITPHVAGGTTAMLPRISALVREQLQRRVGGEPVINVVSR